MNIDILFATTNQGKIQEVKSIFKSLQLLFLDDLDISRPEPVENGDTFLKNAKIKARYYFQSFNIPTIADDSGLVVPALNNEPGVYSSRFAGPNATDAENNLLLLERMKRLKGIERRAYFECVVVYKSGAVEKHFSGKCDGFIRDNPQGTSGFGYDPLFYLDAFHKTFAELTTGQKNMVSHRAKAFEKLKSLLLKTSFD